MNIQPIFIPFFLAKNNNALKGLIDILNFKNKAKQKVDEEFLEEDFETIIPFNINTENKTNSEYECEYELSIIKNADHQETSPQLSTVLNDDFHDNSLEITLCLNNPLLDMKFVPNNNNNNNNITNTFTKHMPEINVKITINANNEEETKNVDDVMILEESYNSLYSSISSLSSLNMHTPFTSYESHSKQLASSMSPIYSVDSSDRTYLNSSKSKELEYSTASKCVSAYQQIMNLLDESLEKNNKSNTLTESQLLRLNEITTISNSNDHYCVHSNRNMKPDEEEEYLEYHEIRQGNVENDFYSEPKSRTPSSFCKNDCQRQNHSLNNISKYLLMN